MNKINKTFKINQSTNLQKDDFIISSHEKSISSNFQCPNCSKLNPIEIIPYQTGFPISEIISKEYVEIEMMLEKRILTNSSKLSKHLGKYLVENLPTLYFQTKCKSCESIFLVVFGIGETSQGYWKCKIAGVWEITMSDGSNTLDDEINNSTLPILTHKIFSHYSNEKTKKDINNPEWQNQELFFWDYDEFFEKKSLPISFKEYQTKYFIFISLPPNYGLRQAKVIPWFGMEGNGNKYSVVHMEKYVPLTELLSEKIIQYVQFVELSNKNSWILKNNENFSIVLTDSEVYYSPKEKHFTRSNKEITLKELYNRGSIKVVKNIS